MIRSLFYKWNKKLVPRAWLCYISTSEFSRTLAKCEKHSPMVRASLSTSLVSLKIPKYFNKYLNSALGAFFIPLIIVAHGMCVAQQLEI